MGERLKIGLIVVFSFTHIIPFQMLMFAHSNKIYKDIQYKRH